jgi:hypothetical protein
MKDSPDNAIGMIVDQCFYLLVFVELEIRHG